MKQSSGLAVFLLGISFALAGCEKSPAPISEGDGDSPVERVKTETCEFALSEGEFLRKFEAKCQDSRMEMKSIREYFHALNALQYGDSNRIERKFFALETWKKEIEAFQEADAICAASLLCGESI